MNAQADVARQVETDETAFRYISADEAGIRSRRSSNGPDIQLLPRRLLAPMQHRIETMFGKLKDWRRALIHVGNRHRRYRNFLALINEF